MAKQFKLEFDRGAQLGLKDDELALYDAACQNDSAVMGLGDDTRKLIAQELVATVRKNARLEQERAGPGYCGRPSSRLLVKYRYPLDKQEAAVHLVMEQAERLAEAVA